MGCAASTPEPEPEAPKPKPTDVSSDEMAEIRKRLTKLADEPHEEKKAFKKGDKSTHKVHRVATGSAEEQEEKEKINSLIREKKEKKAAPSILRSISRGISRKGALRRTATSGKSFRNLLQRTATFRSKSRKAVSTGDPSPPGFFRSLTRSFTRSKRELTRGPSATQLTSDEEPERWRPSHGHNPDEDAAAPAPAEATTAPSKVSFATPSSVHDLDPDSPEAIEAMSA